MTDDWTRAPKVDARTTDTIAQQTDALLHELTDGAWTPAAPGQGQDPLGALVRVFAGLSGHVLDGINAVPDASFAAFLRLIGVEVQRPAPARAPLTFRLVGDAPQDAVVPAGTQVEASADEGDTVPAPILFETEEELVVTRARLMTTCAHAPERDRLDHLGPGPGPLRALDPQTAGVHELDIACPAILARADAGSWIVRLDFEAPPTKLELTWLGDDSTPLAANVAIVDKRLTATITSPPSLQVTTIAGHDEVWLVARQVPRAGSPPPVPRLRQVQLAATFAADNVAPAKVLRGATQIDATTEFAPLDATPTIGSACAFDGGDILAQPPGASVVLDVTLAAAVAAEGARPLATAELRLVWELRDDTGAWIELGRCSGSDPAILVDGKNPHGFVDDSYALTRSGRVRFRLPFTASEGRHNGKVGRWVRVRVLAGAYASGRAPQLGKLRLSYSHTLEAVVADRSVARDLGHTRELGVLDGTGAVQAFTTRPEGAVELGARPALYLGFDRGFEARPVNLYLDVLAPDATETEPPDQIPPTSEVPKIAWEYLGARGWTRLGVRDGSDALRQRGILSFVAPQDLAVAAVFGRTGVWLRARWVSGSFRVTPRIAKVAVNTVWALHAVTHRDEVLGSGTGAPDQRFHLLAGPVLADERIEVRERDQTSERDVAALREELGDDAVTVERNNSGTLTAVWIRWTPVTHFHGSGPADRHYVLDADTGDLRFGDGLGGRAPPRGRANIRAAVYRTGGGLRGNRPAGAIDQLKTAIPYIDGVRNLDAASGGTSREDEARARARGPKRLRHRGRAVTAADLEDLAFEAAPEVARAHALTTSFNPIDVGINLDAADAGTLGADGWVVGGNVPPDTAEVAGRAAAVRVVIVPHGQVEQPVPSLGLLEHVEAYLRDRCPPAMRAHVSGPRWIRVTVRAAVVATVNAAADRLISDLRGEITRFLHPLTGGELGLGWDFGRIPRRSHLYRLLARFPGVHHIESLAVITSPPLPDASEPLSEPQRRALAGGLVYSGAHELTLVGQTEDV
ncbi:putative baseplate assembly protein [Nannocystis sp.]|uniref:putative baseplate assembly protein n=1 Tax=Nannocystis sp. TaxID=1962667 RepID=UPI0025F78DAF|nr:putative baseplate assembly protein [Nannocystis sp.]MBK7830660.1 putative baseplate assembly protein [Nannocystis sp.]